MDIPGESKQRVATRLTAIQVAVALVFGGLAVAFWYIQIVEHARFEELAENNHQRRLALRAPLLRGRCCRRRRRGCLSPVVAPSIH